MTKEMWLGIARHLLTTVGGILVSKGVLDAGMVETAVGAIVTLGGVAWSVMDKKKA